VRIDLVGNARKRRKRRRASRGFDSAIVLPEVRARRGERKKQRAREREHPRALGGQAATQRRQERQASESAAERRARRAAMRTYVRRLPALLLLIALAGALLYTSADARFFVYGAEIHGAQHLAPVTVYEAAEVHEQNIFWIDPEQVARRVVALEGIRAARVSCQLPARVVIEVEERQPAILWRAQSQGKDWWLDAEGRVLPYHGDAESPQTVFVVDVSERQLDLGQTVKPTGVAGSVMQLAEALPDVRLFYYEAERGLSFTQQGATGSWPVYIGSGENLPRKIRVMLALTEYLTANRIRPRYLDVRWPDHPVYGRPAGEASGGGQ
jgi:hypothetical protein